MITSQIVDDGFIIIFKRTIGNNWHGNTITYPSLAVISEFLYIAIAYQQKYYLTVKILNPSSNILSCYLAGK